MSITGEVPSDTSSFAKSACDAVDDWHCDTV